MVRLAEKVDLSRVNEMMNDVNDIHVKARPDFFKAELGDTLIGYLNEILDKTNKDLFVYESDNNIYGQRGINRVELNVWEFNKEAIEFYEAMGFTTYRRYLELKN